MSSSEQPIERRGGRRRGITGGTQVRQRRAGLLFLSLCGRRRGVGKFFGGSGRARGLARDCWGLIGSRGLGLWSFVGPKRRGAVCAVDRANAPLPEARDRSQRPNNQRSRLSGSGVEAGFAVISGTQGKSVH
jgi:hypothetical protein